MKFLILVLAIISIVSSRPFLPDDDDDDFYEPYDIRNCGNDKDISQLVNVTFYPSNPKSGQPFKVETVTILKERLEPG